MRLSGVLAAIVAAIVAGALLAFAYRSIAPRPRPPLAAPIAAQTAPSPSIAVAAPSPSVEIAATMTRLSGEVVMLREARIWLTEELARSRMAFPVPPLERYQLPSMVAPLFERPATRRREARPPAPWAAVVLHTDPLK